VEGLEAGDVARLEEVRKIPFVQDEDPLFVEAKLKLPDDGKAATVI
jgi:hypothetical protein